MSEASSTAPAVAIAVVSYNTSGLLEACLESAAPYVERGLAEVWVVDNASQDDSVRVARDSHPEVRLLALEDNVGFGCAINMVAERTSSEWIAIANADIAFQAGALEALLDAPVGDVGTYAPMLVSPGGGPQHSVHPFPSIWLGLVFNLGLYRLPGVGRRLCIQGWWDPSETRTVDWALGALLLVRRSAFEEIGGFDEEQWLYAEDIDLQWRLRQAGFRTVYRPAARVNHAVSAATTAEFGSDRDALHVAATYDWLARRRGLLHAWCYAALNVAGSAARLAAFSLAAVPAPRRFGRKSRWAREHLRLHALGLAAPSTLRDRAPKPRN